MCIPVILTGIFVQALLYGTYLASLGHCVGCMYFDVDWKLRRSGVNWTISVAMMIIFLLLTINTVSYFMGLLEPDNYGLPEVLVQNLSELLVVAIVDAVLVYRCWAVYAKSWRIVLLPIIFWLGSLASAALNSYYGVLPLQTASSFAHFLQTLISLYSFNIATTVYATTAIVYKISRVAKASSSNSRRLRSVVHIILESGILYTSMTIISMVGITAYLNQSMHDCGIHVFGLVSDTMHFCVAGITFNLIIIRTYQSRDEEVVSFDQSRFSEAG